MKNVNTEKKNY